MISKDKDLLKMTSGRCRSYPFTETFIINFLEEQQEILVHGSFDEDNNIAYVRLPWEVKPHKKDVIVIRYIPYTIERITSYRKPWEYLRLEIKEIEKN